MFYWKPAGFSVAGDSDPEISANAQYTPNNVNVESLSIREDDTNLYHSLSANDDTSFRSDFSRYSVNDADSSVTCFCFEKKGKEKKRGRFFEKKTKRKSEEG